MLNFMTVEMLDSLVDDLEYFMKKEREMHNCKKNAVPSMIIIHD